MPLNSLIELPLKPGFYETRTPSRISKLLNKFTDTTATDDVTGQSAPKERWKAHLMAADGKAVDSEITYEVDGCHVNMRGVPSGLDLVRFIRSE